MRWRIFRTNSSSISSVASPARRSWTSRRRPRRSSARRPTIGSGAPRPRVPTASWIPTASPGRPAATAAPSARASRDGSPPSSASRTRLSFPSSASRRTPDSTSPCRAIPSERTSPSPRRSIPEPPPPRPRPEHPRPENPRPERAPTLTSRGATRRTPSSSPSAHPTRHPLAASRSSTRRRTTPPLASRTFSGTTPTPPGFEPTRVNADAKPEMSRLPWTSPPPWMRSARRGDAFDSDSRRGRSSRSPRVGRVRSARV